MVKNWRTFEGRFLKPKKKRIKITISIEFKNVEGYIFRPLELTGNMYFLTLKYI